jgi:hypothetical protein
MNAVRAVVGPDLQGDILAKQACVFSVSSPSKYVYLVLTVHRVLQGVFVCLFCLTIFLFVFCLFDISIG